jgi:hypothetical protein
LSEEEEKAEDEKRSGGKPLPLTWRDYIALSIAALETVLAPLIVVAVLLFVIALIVTGHL